MWCLSIYGRRYVDQQVMRMRDRKKKLNLITTSIMAGDTARHIDKDIQNIIMAGWTAFAQRRSIMTMTVMKYTLFVFDFKFSAHIS